MDQEELTEKELLEIQYEIDYERMDEILEYLYKYHPYFYNVHWIHPCKALELLDQLGKYDWEPELVAPRETVRDYTHILNTFFLKGFACKKTVNQLHSLFENEIDRCSLLRFKKNI